MKDRAEDIRDKANLTWLQREFCTAAWKADEWISSVFLVQKIDVEGTVRRVVERDVGRPVAAECAARATNAGKDELLTQRRAHDAPFLHDIASTAAARRRGRDDDASALLRNAGVEDERFAALDLVDVDVNEFFERSLAEEQLVVKTRRRIADVPHRERRILEHQLIHRLPRPMHLDENFVARGRRMKGFDFGSGDVAPLVG